MAVLINQVEIILSEPPADAPSGDAPEPARPENNRRAEVSAVDFEMLVQHRRDRQLRRRAH